MSYAAGSTVYTNGLVLTTTAAEPVTTPKGLLITRSVETKEGWVGQIIVDKAIVWESAPMEDQHDASAEATSRVVARLKKLFT